MARITLSTIESNAQDNLLAVMDNRTYIKDPKFPNSTTKNRVFVYESDPFHKGKFDGFPYIICNFPTIEQSNMSVDGKTKNIKWLHNVTVRVVRDGESNSRNNIGRTDILSIADDLHETFNSLARRQDLRDLNMHEIKLTKTNVDTLGIVELTVYEFEYELEYWTRMQVSS